MGRWKHFYKLNMVIELQDHRIGLEGTSGSLQTNILLNSGPAVWSDQGGQCIIWSDLEDLKGWRLCSLSGQPTPLLHGPWPEFCSLYPV